MLESLVGVIDVSTALEGISTDVEGVVTATLPFIVGIFGAALAIKVGKRFFNKA